MKSKLKLLTLILITTFAATYFTAIRPINNILNTNKPIAEKLIKEEFKSSLISIDQGTWFIDLKAGNKKSKQRDFTLYVQILTKSQNESVRKIKVQFIKKVSLSLKLTSHIPLSN